VVFDTEFRGLQTLSPTLTRTVADAGCVGSDSERTAPLNGQQ